tara:strand:- start:486 stop:668 length:183 start_codon:yes stop_codon:yes gene_type:complete
MSKRDYEKFLLKIENLNKLVELINDSPDKYQLFINCRTHQEVIELATKWGFEIDKRWGEY